MRRLWLGALLIGGCFNPKGNETGGGTGTGETSATTGDSATTGPGTSTTTITTGAATAGVTTTEVTTSGSTSTTATSEPTTATSTGSSTSGGDCDPECGQCFDCVDGSCLKKPGIPPCQPPPGSCMGILWGEQDGVCYEATASGGHCDDNGMCQPTCNTQGGKFLTCASLTCMWPDHPCQQGALAASVTMADFCATGGATTPGCKPDCNPVDDHLEAYACDDGGACTLTNKDLCPGAFACDENSHMCKNFCAGNLDCAPGYMCFMNMCQSQ